MLLLKFFVSVKYISLLVVRNSVETQHKIINSFSLKKTKFEIN